MKLISTPFAALICIAVSFAGCKKDKDPTYGYPPIASKGTVGVEFDNIAGSAHVDITGATMYMNNMGESFSVTTLKYYVSNFELIKATGGSYVVPDSYFLINEADVNTHGVELEDVPNDGYTGVRFMVGVDSARTQANAGGGAPFTGALDPVNQMFWTWNTGHIMFKIEGATPAAGGNRYEYHIGGWNGASAVQRMVQINFGGDTLFVEGASREAEVHLMADILKTFSGSTNFSFASDSLIHMPGPKAAAVADNYKDMFMFDHIHND